MELFGHTLKCFPLLRFSVHTKYFISRGTSKLDDNINLPPKSPEGAIKVKELNFFPLFSFKMLLLSVVFACGMYKLIPQDIGSHAALPFHNETQNMHP